MPNNPYATQMRYQREHPFPAEFNTTNINTATLSNIVFNILSATKIYMPLDWKGIIEYATAEKLCDIVGMTDLGMKYHQKLYGYKDKYGSEVPGIIMARMSQQQRQEISNERRLIPICRRYTG